MIFPKRKPTNSEAQLQSDFGEYPPKPLLPMKVNWQFDIVYLDWIGEQINNMKQVAQVVLRLKDSHFRANDPLAIEARKSISAVMKGFLEIKATYKSLSLLNKIVFIVITTIISLPIMLFALFRSRKKIIGVYKTFKILSRGVLGSFNHLSDSPQFTVYKPFYSRFIKKDCPAEGVTSHEHIHFLQNYYFPERNEKKFRDRKDRVLKNILIDPEVNFDRMSYYFEVNEMEARLHEVILSYYREYGELPSDQTGFSRLFFGSRGVNRKMMEVMKTSGIEPSSLKLREFDVRCNLMESQMLTAISQLRAPFEFDYMLYVLPVLYGNLLIVYGDTNQAKKYFDTVSSFEFYNELYGEIIIPVKHYPQHLPSQQKPIPIKK